MGKPTTPEPDLSEFLTASRPKKKRCPVGHAMGELDAAGRAQLHAACRTDIGVITNKAIITWLAARGHPASINLVASHRHGTCTCHEHA